jgi:hypothetical protein
MVAMPGMYCALEGYFLLDSSHNMTKKHSPGRFFAVNEIKAMFAHILLNYDVQLENGSMERPANLKVEAATMPNVKAKVMFRKRQVR